jgi:hypothetical protein
MGRMLALALAAAVSAATVAAVNRAHHRGHRHHGRRHPYDVMDADSESEAAGHGADRFAVAEAEAEADASALALTEDQLRVATVMRADSTLEELERAWAGMSDEQLVAASNPIVTAVTASVALMSRSLAALFRLRAAAVTAAADESIKVQAAETNRYITDLMELYETASGDVSQRLMDLVQRSAQAIVARMSMRGLNLVAEAVLKDSAGAEVLPLGDVAAAHKAKNEDGLRVAISQLLVAEIDATVGLDADPRFAARNRILARISPTLAKALQPPDADMDSSDFTGGDLAPLLTKVSGRVRVGGGGATGAPPCRLHEPSPPHVRSCGAPCRAAVRWMGWSWGWRAAP